MGLLDGMDQPRRACSLAPALERAHTALADDTPPAALPREQRVWLRDVDP